MLTNSLVYRALTLIGRNREIIGHSLGDASHARIKSFGNPQTRECRAAADRRAQSRGDAKSAQAARLVKVRGGQEPTAIAPSHAEADSPHQPRTELAE